MSSTNNKKFRKLEDNIKIYLAIIPDNTETKEYRKALISFLDKLESEEQGYWAPEVFSDLWRQCDSILFRYNTLFIDKEKAWATAILYVCNYDYDKEELEPYRHLL